MRNLLLRLSLLLAAVTAGAQTATYVSNLTETTGSSNTLTSGEIAAQAFTTGSQATTLSSISLSFTPVSSSVTGFSLSLYADNAGLPGSALETFTGSASPSNGTFAYNSVGTTLSANTTYWLYATVTGPGTTYLDKAGSPNETSSYGWTIADQSKFNSGSWFNYTTFVFSATASPAAVPEPSTYAAIAGLGALGLVILRRRRA